MKGRYHKGKGPGKNDVRSGFRKVLIFGFGEEEQEEQA
jgi:hypothetical protein